jgi:hypothetical protein
VTREELEHAIRAACDVAKDDAVYVFGSQAILGQFPDAPAALRMSAEVDMTPTTRLEHVDSIDGALGELSPFHEAFGFYVHGVPIETAILPAGWETRLIVVRNANTRQKTGLCIEAHDLAASKLAAFREKDREFVRTLLATRMVAKARLIARLRRLPLEGTRTSVLVKWVEATDRDLHPDRRAPRR